VTSTPTKGTMPLPSKYVPVACAGNPHRREPYHRGPTRFCCRYSANPSITELTNTPERDIVTTCRPRRQSGKRIETDWTDYRPACSPISIARSLRGFNPARNGVSSSVCASAPQREEWGHRCARRGLSMEGLKMVSKTDELAKPESIRTSWKPRDAPA
jgi:hypothetical protein